MIALSITAPIFAATASPSLMAEISGSITMTSDERRRVVYEFPAPRAAPPRTGTT